MAAKFIVNGENVTIQFSYTASIMVAQDTVTAAVGQLYNAGLRTLLPDVELLPFEDLTNQQKLDILDKWILKRIVELARDKHKADALIAAQESALIESNEKFINS